MLHDIAPHTLANAWNPRPALPEDLTLYFDNGNVYLKDGHFPCRADYPYDAVTRYLFDYDGCAVHLSMTDAPKNARPTALRNIRNMDQPEAFLGGTAQHLWDWYRKTRFCGCCGTEMTHSTAERAMLCPHCGNTVYPCISPAVIVLIHNGADKLFLARGRRFVGNFYSCIAGYLEIGETLEQAVLREAMEETGLHLKNLRYFGNQPWPFSDTQMVGFFAEADENEPVSLQEEELADAKWFHKDELPTRPQSIAIASAMIHHWLEHGAL